MTDKVNDDNLIIIHCNIYISQRKYKHLAHCVAVQLIAR